MVPPVRQHIKEPHMNDGDFKTVSRISSMLYNILKHLKGLYCIKCHGELISQDLCFCLSESFVPDTTTLLSMSREEQRAPSGSWQLEMLILGHERGLTARWTRGPQLFVYSVIISTRHLDCVLAEHQRPCRDCRATRQLHWPLISMNSRPFTAAKQASWQMDMWSRVTHTKKKKENTLKISLSNLCLVEISWWNWVRIEFKWKRGMFVPISINKIISRAFHFYNGRENCSWLYSG